MKEGRERYCSHLTLTVQYSDRCLILVVIFLSIRSKKEEEEDNDNEDKMEEEDKKKEENMMSVQLLRLNLLKHKHSNINQVANL